MIVLLLIVVNGLTLLKAAMVKLKPLQCRGIINGKSAVFLSKSKELEIIEDENSSIVTLCDLVGLSLKTSDEFYDRILSKDHHKASSVTRSELISSCKYFINRDNGIYDNIPYKWKRINNPKKELYDFLSGGEAYSYDGTNKLTLANSQFRNLNSEQFFEEAIEQILGIRMLQFVIEVSDMLSSDRFKLGGAMVVAKTDYDRTSKNPLPAPYDESSEQEICVITCQIDEIVLLALGLNKPVYMENDLFQQISMDYSLNRDEDGSMSISSTNSGVSEGSFTSKDALPDTTEVAWDIFNPKRFLSMSILEKRAILRSSGVKAIPRPREGSAALNNALMNVMDDSVRREFVRLSDPNAFMNTKNVAETEEQELLRTMGEALERGAVDEAQSLREKFAMKRQLRADPTQASGSYDRYLDQDDWYMEARRRAMAPRKSE